MLRNFKGLLIFIFILGNAINYGFAQKQIIDQVIAVVGNNVILQSEVETQYLELISRGVTSKRDLKCEILEEFLAQKLLLNQARIDSIEVTDAQVEMQLDQRMQFFINQVGSEKELMEYFGKSIVEIKEDLRDVVRENIITQQMQSEITGSVSITPAEVREYYNTLEEDSIPYVDAMVELSQIVKYPPYTEEEIFAVKEKLLKLRERILNGESFSKLAVLYSEGPSSPRGGEIGFLSKAELDPAYAAAAFSLSEGGVSRIVESAFGFHIIQLIERRGDRVNTRHILMKPKISLEEVARTKEKLDSIVRLVRIDTFTFEEAARRFSDDKNTKINGGQLVNPGTGNTRFLMDDLDPKEYYVLKDLKVGQISAPFESIDQNGKTVYKVMMIKSRTEPHVANLKEDFNLLKNMALAKKREEVINNWIDDKQKTTYIRIDDSFANCDFHSKGWFK